MLHREHPLVLQFNSEQLSCKTCLEEGLIGFVYGCSPCKFAVHIECVFPSPIIEDKSHPHPFTLFPRRLPFICDACGAEGNYAAYICCTCNIIVHKKCISLPCIIISKWHDHRIYHKYFLPRDFRNSVCDICHDEVNPELGCYCCSHCNITFHVRCVTEDKYSYSIPSREDEDEISNESSITVLEWNDAKKATKIKHFKHMHNLMLSDSVGGYENSCDGCMLPISDPFYYCSQCDFFLYKACAESLTMKRVWHHEHCKQPLILISDKVFSCEICLNRSNGFAYECSECTSRTCLRCVIALTPGARTCLKHKHPLRFYRRYKGKCNACSHFSWGAFCCKDCNFVLDLECFSLPIMAQHKCDQHLLSLTDPDDNDDNSYSENHYCDICEESRDPNHHPHPLTIMKKKYYYPDCDKCGKPCEDLAIECLKSECKYIIHWDCVALSSSLQRLWNWSM
ncbi:hypothetical protein ERO13_A02G016902v2 [Gossypium hirsutum]|nr:hypothetical protein ERO13_A02G016902v2 [Gossypium hirsutum]